MTHYSVINKKIHPKMWVVKEEKKKLGTSTRERCSNKFKITDVCHFSIPIEKPSIHDNKYIHTNSRMYVWDNVGISITYRCILIRCREGEILEMRKTISAERKNFIPRINGIQVKEFKKNLQIHTVMVNHLSIYAKGENTNTK